MNMQYKEEFSELDETFIKNIQPYYERLFIKAYSIVKNKEDAKDILQEALIAAYKAFSKFKGKSNLYTWLYKIVVNKCIDFLRNSKKEDNLIQKISKPYNPNNSHLDFFLYEFEEIYEQNKIFKSLIKIVNNLENKYKELIIMKYFDGLTYEEIAEIKNIKLGTVKSRLSKAKEKILLMAKNDKILKDFLISLTILLYKEIL